MAFISLSDRTDSPGNKRIYNPLGFFESPSQSDSDISSPGMTETFRPKRKARRKPQIKQSPQPEKENIKEGSGVPENKCAFHAHLEQGSNEDTDCHLSLSSCAENIHKLKEAIDRHEIIEHKTEISEECSEVSSKQSFSYFESNNLGNTPHFKDEEEILILSEDGDITSANGDKDDEIYSGNGDKDDESDSENGNKDDEIYSENGDKDDEIYSENGDKGDEIYSENGDKGDESGSENGDKDDEITSENGDKDDEIYSENGDKDDEITCENGDKDDEIYSENGDKGDESGSENGDKGDENGKVSHSHSAQQREGVSSEVDSLEDILVKPRSYIFETRCETANELRLLGNDHFTKGALQCALDCYQRGLHHVDFDETQMFDLAEQHIEILNAAKLPLHMNQCLCLTKLAHSKTVGGDVTLLSKALKEADAALLIEPGHFKALMQRGKSLMSLGKCEQGLVSLKKGLENAPSDVEVVVMKKMIKNATATLKAEEQEKKAREKVLWGGKFKGGQGRVEAVKLAPVVKKNQMFKWVRLLVCFLIAFCLAWWGRSGVEVVPEPVVREDTADPPLAEPLPVSEGPSEVETFTETPQRRGPRVWVRKIAERLKNRRERRQQDRQAAAHSTVVDDTAAPRRRPWNWLKRLRERKRKQQDL